MSDLQNRMQNLEKLTKIDDKIIIKLHKIASFYEDSKKAFGLIVQRIYIDSGSIRIRIDFETTQDFDSFIKQQECSFKKRNKKNIRHKIFILENTLDIEPVRKIICVNSSLCNKNTNKVIIDYHGGCFMD